MKGDCFLHDLGGKQRSSERSLGLKTRFELNAAAAWCSESVTACVSRRQPDPDNTQHEEEKKLKLLSTKLDV